MYLMNRNLTIGILKDKIQHSLAEQCTLIAFLFRNLICRNLAL